jgi:hypothetical protein
VELPWQLEAEEVCLQFRLTYRGKLPAASRNDTRMKEKHHIRRVFATQLAELWRTHDFLQQFMQPHVREVRFTPEDVNARTIEELREQMIHTAYDDFSEAHHAAARFTVADFRFMPLVGTVFNGVTTTCGVDILFLRRDAPGKLVSGGGDIDNRLKTLLDALRMPKTGELPLHEKPTDEEKPFFCLVEDDSLITEIKVVTDRLLTPLTSNERETDVHLIIHVRTELIRLSAGADMGAAAAFLT